MIWAEHLFKDVEADASLFSRSSNFLDYLFALILYVLGLGALGFSKGSLRAGGATYFYRGVVVCGMAHI